MTALSRSTGVLLVLLLLAASARAQFDPGSGEWGKDDPTHLRVMTWNVFDNINSQELKIASLVPWEACVRIVASLRPDVLLLQEAGDTGSGVDSVADLETTIDLFLHGGNDPFNGNQAVTSYVQLYAPSYDLPYVFVSGANDGFNRNVILSRHPFADLNGDGADQHADFVNLADLWAPGVNGGIRGFTHAEIDLPDGTYAGDLVIGNSHLKAGGSGSDEDDRRVAAQNIAYYIDALYNGLGTGTADPNGKIIVPAASQLVGPDDVVVCGGDWNEDELTNGQKGPADWITRAELTGGTDGTDRDRTDMTYDSALEPFSGDRATIGSSSKFDYLAWQDSIATLANSFVFRSSSIPIGLEPPELSGFPGNPTLASGLASDHRPVIVDLVLPAGGCAQSPATDLGFAKAGTGGLEPHQFACGSLGTGDTADFFLEDALPNTQAWLVLGLSSAFLPFSGGTLVPAPDILIGPLPTSPTGTIDIPGVVGGGGPFDVWIQWAVVDPGATFGRSLSNGLEVHFDP